MTLIAAAQLLASLLNGVALMGLLLYGLNAYVMIALHWRTSRGRHAVPAPPDVSVWPLVTVQLPLYNERYVARRLLQAAANLDYPADRLEIQVLDDSTDDTKGIVAEMVQRLQDRGVDIAHVHRVERTGFKAGALAAGLEKARGEFVAIFDADFVPPSDFLRRTIPHFAESRVGVVQTRWGHLNQDFSLLTRAQSLGIDGHFGVEQTARCRGHLLLNFNGTAGIWRRRCLEQIGGWESDTLTEDLDISYRAQLAGWKFVYLKDLVAPAELPVDMNGFKSQQHRWTKGSIQTGRKLLPAIFKSDFPWKVKAEAFFHLTNNYSYLLVVLLALLILPAIIIRERIGWQRVAILDFPLFFGATFSFIAFYVSSQREIGRDWKPTLKCMPILMSVGIGLSLNNMHAVLEAVANRRTEFRRTPKYRIETHGDEWRDKKYRSRGNFSLVGEVVLAVYFLAAIVFAIVENYWIGVPFLLMFFNGFAYTAMLSFASRWSGGVSAAAFAARTGGRELSATKAP